MFWEALTLVGALYVVVGVAYLGRGVRRNGRTDQGAHIDLSTVGALAFLAFIIFVPSLGLLLDLIY